MIVFLLSQTVQIPPWLPVKAPAGEMDYLITMGYEETCSAVPTKKVIDWQIPDPKGKLLDAFRNVRDMIEEKVRILLKGIE